MLGFHEISRGMYGGLMKVLQLFFFLQGVSAYINTVTLGQQNLCVINSRENHPVLLNENF